VQHRAARYHRGAGVRACAQGQAAGEEAGAGGRPEVRRAAAGAGEVGTGIIREAEACAVGGGEDTCGA